MEFLKLNSILRETDYFVANVDSANTDENIFCLTKSPCSRESCWYDVPAEILSEPVVVGSDLADDFLYQRVLFRPREGHDEIFKKLKASLTTERKTRVDYSYYFTESFSFYRNEGDVTKSYTRTWHKKGWVDSIFKWRGRTADKSESNVSVNWTDNEVLWDVAHFKNNEADDCDIISGLRVHYADGGQVDKHQILRHVDMWGSGIVVDGRVPFSPDATSVEVWREVNY